MGCLFTKRTIGEKYNIDPDDSSRCELCGGDVYISELYDRSWDFENLVIEGGSTNGTVTIGAYKILEKVGIIDKIIRFAGSSSGSMLAALAATRMPADVMEREYLNMNMCTLQDDSVGILRDAARLFKEYGFYKGDVLEKWADDMLYISTGIKNITFDEILEKYGTELYITVVNLDKVSVEYLNPYDNPHMRVSKAIRHSASIPLIFKAPKNDYGNVMADGAMGDGYPIDLFDNNEGKNNVNMKTIGLKIMSPTLEKRTSRIQEQLGYEIDSLADYVNALLVFQSIMGERSKIREGFWERTITLDSPDRPFTDFDISVDEKKDDVSTGASNTVSALIRYLDKGSF